jgi:16S rRNA (guanine527-N7)-methyltransferase
MARPNPLTYIEVRPVLERWAARFPGFFDETARGAVGCWLELLCTWNARIDLTAARSPAELVDLMLADALTLADEIPRGARVLDVGTGAGAPGLGLALARRDLAVTLCEPLAKRASFLRTVLGSVGRTDVSLVSKRGEELKGEWDAAISRATLPPEEWLALGTKLTRPGGNVWVLLANIEPPAAPGATLEAVTRYEWPETQAVRSAARYKATGRP